MIEPIIIGILLLVIFALILYIRHQRRMVELRVEERLLKETDRIKRETLSRSRAVLKGKIGEQMAPLLEAFPFEPADARFIGSPIDYIVFPGYSKQNPTEVVLIDIKTGRASLSSIERRIRELVQARRVRWMTITI
jgi:predicted Holliday junction resolvase-like endonuclease